MCLWLLRGIPWKTGNVDQSQQQLLVPYILNSQQMMPCLKGKNGTFRGSGCLLAGALEPTNQFILRVNILLMADKNHSGIYEMCDMLPWTKKAWSRNTEQSYYHDVLQVVDDHSARQLLLMLLNVTIPTTVHACPCFVPTKSDYGKDVRRIQRITPASESWGRTQKAFCFFQTRLFSFSKVSIWMDIKSLTRFTLFFDKTSPISRNWTQYLRFRRIVLALRILKTNSLIKITGLVLSFVDSNCRVIKRTKVSQIRAVWNLTENWTS